MQAESSGHRNTVIFRGRVKGLRRGFFFGNKIHFVVQRRVLRKSACADLGEKVTSLGT